jgi:hypothetical protein
MIQVALSLWDLQQAPEMTWPLSSNTAPYLHLHGTCLKHYQIPMGNQCGHFSVEGNDHLKVSYFKAAISMTSNENLKITASLRIYLQQLTISSSRIPLQHSFRIKLLDYQARSQEVLQ